MIYKIIFYSFLLYLVYRLIFNFILPVYRTSRQIKKGFTEMQEKMRQQEEQHPPNPSKKGDKNQVGEYIDFEEVE